MAGLRLLVASHDASRTGAPLVLLTFLRWLRRSTDAEVQLVLWRGGPLVDAFAEVADVTVLHPEPGRRSLAETVELGLAEVGLPGLADRATGARVRARLRVADHDVLYLNGAGSALVAAHLPSSAPTVAHVHELDRGLTACLRGEGGKRFLASARFVAVAQVVADRLVDGWGVPRDRITVVHECLPDRVAGATGAAPDLPPAVPLVASVGAGSWRKGVDLFVQVAAGVHRALPGPVRFAWVGRLDDEAAVAADRHSLGLDDVLVLPGEVDDPTPWFERMTVFCSTAREDPFPLVALEAGAAGVPIVSFANGGITELLAGGLGTVVGPLDVPAMVEAVTAALQAPPDVAELRAHVLARHTIEAIGPALLAEVEAAG